MCGHTLCTLESSQRESVSPGRSLPRSFIPSADVSHASSGARRLSQIFHKGTDGGSTARKRTWLRLAVWVWDFPSEQVTVGRELSLSPDDPASLVC